MARCERRLPHNLHVSFDGIEGEALLMALGDLAVSTGSACSSGSQAPSHVLQAIGAVGEGAGASIRFGLGRWTTDADIDFAIDRVTTVVRSLRQRQTVGRSVRRQFPVRSLQYSSFMSETRITVAHSPDSDDAFMFFGLATAPSRHTASSSTRCSPISRR